MIIYWAPVACQAQVTDISVLENGALLKLWLKSILFEETEFCNTDFREETLFQFGLLSRGNSPRALLGWLFTYSFSDGAHCFNNLNQINVSCIYPLDMYTVHSFSKPSSLFKKWSERKISFEYSNGSLGMNGILTIPFWWQKSVIHLKCFSGKTRMDYWCFLHGSPYLSTSPESEVHVGRGRQGLECLEWIVPSHVAL